MGNSNSTKKIVGEENQSDSSAIPSRRCVSSNEHRTAEAFSLIWLDEHAEGNSLDCLRTQTLFREITNDNCLFFNQCEQFLVEIEKMNTEKKKMLLVISGSFAKEVLPKLGLRIQTIIIFCGNYNKYIHLRDQHRDIVEICTTHEQLKNSIQNELNSYKLKLFENQIFKSIRPLNSTDGTANLSAYHSYLSFIQLLKQMPQTKQAKDIMLSKCEDYYRGDRVEKPRIQLFRDTYTSDRAIDWYRLDSFVYRLVNRAFRTEDVTLWYVFRYFVIDLCQQLENVHHKQNIQIPLILYRGQPRMLTSELEYLKSNIGCLVSTNGFLSTSKDLEIARGFIPETMNTEDFKDVIFQISVDSENLRNTIFVDIDQYKPPERPDEAEAEVLFNIGSVFQIENVIDYDEDLRVPVIKMKATDQGTHEIKRQFGEKQNQSQKDNINLMFGRLLIDMNEYSKAESYFQMLLQELPKSHRDRPLVHDYIGDLAMKSTNWNEALKSFELTYEMKKKFYPSKHSLLGITLNNLGNYYQAIGDDNQALEYCTKAARCQHEQSNMARIQLNIGFLHAKKEEYDKAIRLCTEARDNLHQMHPLPYHDIIYGQGILGQIYFMKKDYDSAENFYSTALEMSEQVLAIGDRIRISCIKALVNLYYEQNFKEKAIDFCEKKLILYEKSLPKHHISIAHLLMKLAQVYDDHDMRKIDSLQRALRILEKSIHLEYATTSNCLIMIAQYKKQQHGYESAYNYYARALEIQTKIYPKDHSIILETQSMIDQGENKI